MASQPGTKPPRKNSEESEQDDSEESEEYDANQYENDGFVVDDDEYDEESISEEKPARKKKKKKRKRESSYDEDDLADDDIYLMEENDKALRRNKFNRLRNYRQKDDDEPEEAPYRANEYEIMSEDQYEIAEEGIDSEYEGSDIEDIRNKFEHNIEDIFEPAGLEEIYIKKEDELIVKADIPERLQLKFKNRLEEKDLKDELPEEAKWIFERMKERFEERRYDRVKEKILKVLELIRLEHCEVMFIYYYRRLVYAEELNLDCLWRIYQLDEEWATVRELKRWLSDTTMQFLRSLDLEMHPSVTKLLETASDAKTLKLLKEHVYFELFRRKADMKKKKGDAEEPATGRRRDKKKVLARPNLIAEVEKQPDLVRAIKKEKFWLSPSYLFENIIERSQRNRPYTPPVNPTKYFEKFIDPKRPLFTYHSLHRTISKYLELELFTYPYLRRWIYERYLKKVVASTILTKKGEHDIGLYSSFYPVKRIVKKPVTTFRGDMWLLMLEAEKDGLLKIDLCFEWQLNSATLNYENDPVYKDLTTNYFDHSRTEDTNTYLWNRYRMEIIKNLLQNHIIPSLHRYIKQDLYRYAEKDVIATCGQKFRAELNKGPAMKRDGKPPIILALVLEHDKLGMAVVNPQGELLFKGIIKVSYESSIEFIVKDRVLNDHIDEYKPDLIAISANCRQSIILRKELREIKELRRPYREYFCALGEYEICSLIAKREIMKGSNYYRAILEAISLARLKLNGMAEVLTMWSEKTYDNGVLYMNMHPLQKSINQLKLKAYLERIAVEMVNLVGIDLNQIKDHAHLQNQLQFISGLGPRKALSLLDNLKKIFPNEKYIRRRRQLLNEKLLGDTVYRNCSGFFKINTKQHQDYLEYQRLDKKSSIIVLYADEKEPISLLDSTRIHDEWYKTVSKACIVAASDLTVNIIVIQRKKTFEEDQAIAEIMKNPGKLRNIYIDKNGLIDQYFICSYFVHPFKDPREAEGAIDNREIFFSILRETNETLKKYMVFSVKIISVSQHFLNVKIIDNGLMGSIRLPPDVNSTDFKKDGIIKAVIVRFPFDPADPKMRHNESRPEAHHEEQELLKVEMALNFPHSTLKPHNCLAECFENIVREVHPRIDLHYFQPKNEDIPVIEIKEELKTRTELRLINHPKFKNIGISKAIEWVNTEPIGYFVIRPSSTGGKDHLTITWKFYEGVIAHIPIKMESKSNSIFYLGMSGLHFQYRIESSREPRIYNSFDEIIENYIKPVNRFMQDVATNRKFLPIALDVIEERLKLDRQKDSSVIHYYFGCSSQLPYFVTLLYIEKENKVVRYHIKVKDDGLAFHGERFLSIKDLVQWFKTHFKDRDYQKYVPKGNTLPSKR